MSYRVLGIGEALWDILPTGPKLGGAPVNFAYHARQLGANAKVITRVGVDERGAEILRRFAEMGIAGETVQIDEAHPTGTATVALGRGGVPEFTLTNEVAWDFSAFTPAVQKAARAAQAVCFGSLAQRNETARTTIKRVVAAAPFDALKIFDINLRQQFYNRALIKDSLDLANVLKLNEHELPVLAGMFGLSGPVPRQLQNLAERFELDVIALTRGENGSLLYRKGAWSDLPGKTVKVADTVGAGDSFTAALAMGLLHGLDLERIHHIATEVAAYVCSCSGATPPLPPALRASFTAQCSTA